MVFIPLAFEARSVWKSCLVASVNLGSEWSTFSDASGRSSTRPRCLLHCLERVHHVESRPHEKDAMERAAGLKEASGGQKN